MNHKQSLVFLQHELKQTYLRFYFIIIVFIAMFIYNNLDSSIDQTSFKSMLLFPIIFSIITLVYFFILKRYPDFHQLFRIKAMLMFEIIATVSTMYLAPELSAYFPFMFLWFTIGYSIRYGLEFGYITYFLSIVSWILLLTNSIFWHEHLNFAFGWLIALIIVPLYFFKLIKKLHKNLSDFEYLSQHDALTKLANRTLFDETLNHYISSYKRKKEKFALLFIDLDDFKKINDTYGHEIGDQVLIEVSQRISMVSSFASRLSGDEFVALIKYKDETSLLENLNQFEKVLFSGCKKHNIVLSASIGVALFGTDAATSYELKKNADEAMYHAKNSGKNRYVFYKDIV